jgi:hypothetical protein
VFEGAGAGKKSLGERVVQRMRKTRGITVDQLTLNNVMDAMIPDRIPQDTASVALSPFDGLPLEQTVTAQSLGAAVVRAAAVAESATAAEAEAEAHEEFGSAGRAGGEGVGHAGELRELSLAIDLCAFKLQRDTRWGEGEGVEGPGSGEQGRKKGGGEVGVGVGKRVAGSGIDWLKTYKLLMLLEGTCLVSAVRNAAAVPGEGKSKSLAAMRCLEVLARYGTLLLFPAGQAPGWGRADKESLAPRGRRLYAVPTVSGGFRPLALVVASGSIGGGWLGGPGEGGGGEREKGMERGIELPLQISVGTVSHKSSIH